MISTKGNPLISFEKQKLFEVSFENTIYRGENLIQNVVDRQFAIRVFLCNWILNQRLTLGYLIRNDQDFKACFNRVKDSNC